MALNDRGQKGWRRFCRSFLFAAHGLLHVLRFEQNMRLHAISTVLVISAGMYFHISPTRWLVLILVIGGVLALEIMNTAIERTVDLITKEYHPEAGIIKDIAAAAVFVFSMAALIIGVIIFFRPVMDWLFQ